MRVNIKREREEENIERGREHREREHRKRENREIER